MQIQLFTYKTTNLKFVSPPWKNFVIHQTICFCSVFWLSIHEILEKNLKFVSPSGLLFQPMISFTYPTEQLSTFLHGKVKTIFRTIEFVSKRKDKKGQIHPGEAILVNKESIFHHMNRYNIFCMNSYAIYNLQIQLDFTFFIVYI